MEEFDNAARLHVVPTDPWVWKNLNETSTVVWGFFCFPQKSSRVGAIGRSPWEAALSQRWLPGGMPSREGVEKAGLDRGSCRSEVRSPEVYLILQGPSRSH